MRGECDGECGWIANPVCWFVWVGPFVFVYGLAVVVGNLSNAELTGVAGVAGGLSGWVSRGLWWRFTGKR